MNKPIAFKAAFTVVFFALCLSLVMGAKQKSVYVKAERTTLSLSVDDALHCSATAISEYAILTADHCFPTDEAIVFKIDGREAKARKFARDGNDHVMILVDIAFEYKGQFANTKPEKGDAVFYFGNPGMKQLFRKGSVAGFDGTDTILDVNGWHGDSGAAVFNEQGKIISIVSAGYHHGIFKLVIVHEFAFTSTQYKDFGVIR